jgi:hypothetical protein
MLGSGRREQQPCNLEHWYVFFLTFRNSVFAELNWSQFLAASKLPAEEAMSLVD